MEHTVIGNRQEVGLFSNDVSRLPAVVGFLVNGPGEVEDLSLEVIRHINERLTIYDLDFLRRIFGGIQPILHNAATECRLLIRHMNGDVKVFPKEITIS